MNDQLRSLALVLACGLVASAALAAPAPDGTILSRSPVALPDDAPAAAHRRAEGVRLEKLVYASGGYEVEAYLAAPAEPAGAPLPCIVYNRGGNRDFGGLTPVRMAFLAGALLRRGYVVVASNYRGNGEHGAALYPPERRCAEGDGIGGAGREEFGGADVDDVLALIPLVESLPEVDAERLGLFGWSRGGMMTYLALRRTDRFRAAVVGAGVADLRGMGDERPEMIEHVYAELIPGWDDPARREKELADRSAVLWADQLPESTPILILHGTGDWRVMPRQALEMGTALLAARRPYRLMMFEGGDHGLSEYRYAVNRAVG
ncbi:prolyl oligopeptidase family serine peptidase, partial [bacterium]|nr:prolyl oligopeptidase family serine peptidase [bacterium]